MVARGTNVTEDKQKNTTPPPPDPPTSPLGMGLETPSRPDPHGVFTLAWSGTGTGTGTGIMHNLSHCTWTGKNGLYGFNKNLSDCTWTGTGKNTSIHHQEHFQDLKNGYQTHSSGPENVPSVLPCPCSGTVWKVLIKTIKPILPGPGPGSGPSQCEYTINLPPGPGPGDPLPTRPPTPPPGYGSGDPPPSQTPQPPPWLWVWRHPTVNRMTDTCKNITFTNFVCRR